MRQADSMIMTNRHDLAPNQFSESLFSELRRCWLRLDVWLQFQRDDLVFDACVDMMCSPCYSCRSVRLFPSAICGQMSFVEVDPTDRQSKESSDCRQFFPKLIFPEVRLFKVFCSCSSLLVDKNVKFSFFMLLPNCRDHSEVASSKSGQLAHGTAIFQLERNVDSMLIDHKNSMKWNPHQRNSQTGVSVSNPSPPHLKRKRWLTWFWVYWVAEGETKRIQRSSDFSSFYEACFLSKKASSAWRTEKATPHKLPNKGEGLDFLAQSKFTSYFWNPNLSGDMGKGFRPFSSPRFELTGLVRLWDLQVCYVACSNCSTLIDSDAVWPCDWLQKQTPSFNQAWPRCSSIRACGTRIHLSFRCRRWEHLCWSCAG